MEMNEIKLFDGHWTHESYTQRMTAKEWKNILLQKRDTIVFEGRIRYLKARKLGYGVVSISKAALIK